METYLTDDYYRRPRLGIAPASAMIRENRGGDFIEDYVAEILTLIEEDIHRAVEARHTAITVEIPTNFDIPGMVKSRAQKFVYYYLLQSLKQAGYYPEISIQGNRHKTNVFLKISWMSPHEEEMESNIDRFIGEHMARTKEPENPPEDTPPASAPDVQTTKKIKKIRDKSLKAIDDLRQQYHR